MGFGVFSNFKLKGGAKNFQRIPKGGEEFSIFDFLESLGKIKGHVKNLLRK